MPRIRIRYLNDKTNRYLTWAYWLSILMSVGLSFVANYLKQFEILAVFISLTGAVFLFLGLTLAVIHQTRSTHYFYGGCAALIIGVIFFFFAFFLTYTLSEVLFPIFW